MRCRLSLAVLAIAGYANVENWTFWYRDFAAFTGRATAPDNNHTRRMATDTLLRAASRPADQFFFGGDGRRHAVSYAGRHG